MTNDTNRQVTGHALVSAHRPTVGRLAVAWAAITLGVHSPSVAAPARCVEPAFEVAVVAAVRAEWSAMGHDTSFVRLHRDTPTEDWIDTASISFFVFEASDVGRDWHTPRPSKVVSTQGALHLRVVATSSGEMCLLAGSRDPLAGFRRFCELGGCRPAVREEASSTVAMFQTLVSEQYDDEVDTPALARWALEGEALRRLESQQAAREIRRWMRQHGDSVARVTGRVSTTGDDGWRTTMFIATNGFLVRRELWFDDATGGVACHDDILAPSIVPGIDAPAFTCDRRPDTSRVNTGKSRP